MLRVGIWGCGGISAMHRSAYKKMEECGAGVKLVALCDINKENFDREIKINLSKNAQPLAKIDRCYTDIDEMLEKEQLNMVDVCLPSQLHKEAAIKLLRRNINVLLEKPMALSAQDCREIIAAEDRSEARLMVAQCERFTAGSDYLKVAAVHEPQGFVFNGADGVRMIAEKSRRPCEVVADFGNVLFADEKIGDFVPAFAGRIVNVHVKDYKTYPAGTYDENAYEFMSVSHTALADCPLGEGVVDFDRGFAELDKIGYRGSVALECLPTGADDTAEFEHNLGFLKRYVE